MLKKRCRPLCAAPDTSEYVLLGSSHADECLKCHQVAIPIPSHAPLTSWGGFLPMMQLVVLTIKAEDGSFARLVH